MATGAEPHPGTSVTKAVIAASQLFRRGLAWKLLLGVGLVVGAVLAWKLTPLAELTKPEEIAQRLDAFEKYRWAPLIMIGAYLVGGLVAFPVTVLGAAVAITFPPWKAAPIALIGILLSAGLHHWLGARFLKSRASASLKRIRERLDEVLTDQGIVTLAALRMVPIAPFTLVNLVAGCMGVRFRDFMLGTALGVAPSITLMCLFGRQVRAFWRDPSATGVALIVALAIAWIGLAFALQKFVTHLKNRSGGAKKAGPKAARAA